MPQRRPQRPLLFVCCVLLLHLQQVHGFDDFLDDIVEVATDLWDAGVDFFRDVLEDDDNDTAATTLSPTAVPTDPILGQQAAACSANSACMVFPGNCCPNELGQFIACCDGVQPTNIISNLVLFEQGTPLDGYVLDLRTVDINDLYLVAIIQPELLIEAVRFTLGPFPPLLVGPRDGVFVLGPLRLAPFPLDAIMENGTYTVTAVALDAMGKEAGNTFTTDITVEGVGETTTTTAPPTLTPTLPTTTSPPTTATPTTLQPTTGTFSSSTNAADCTMHPACPQVPGQCCPNEFGGFYACCWEGVDGLVAKDEAMFETPAPTTAIPTFPPFSPAPVDPMVDFGATLTPTQGNFVVTFPTQINEPTLFPTFVSILADDPVVGPDTMTGTPTMMPSEATAVPTEPVLVGQETSFPTFGRPRTPVPVTAPPTVGFFSITETPTTVTPAGTAVPTEAGIARQQTSFPTFAPSTVAPTKGSMATGFPTMSLGTGAPTMGTPQPTTDMPTSLLPTSMEPTTATPTGMPSSTPSRSFMVFSPQPTGFVFGGGTDAPTAMPIIPTSFPTRTDSVVVSPPPTDVPTGAPMAFPTVPRDTPFTLNPTVRAITDAPTAFRPVSLPPVFPTNPPVTGAPTSIPTTSPIDPPTPFPTQSIDGQQVALCSAFPNCLAASLSGNCCPNAAGVFLDCCRNNGPVPTSPPTAFPTGMPVEAPVTSPPTSNPTAFPTGMPVEAPVTSPPTQSPTEDPTSSPTARPTGNPTSQPTPRPTTPFPTGTPTFEPTRDPIANPTALPTLNPTNEPTVRITAEPTSSPTGEPTSAPTTNPTAGPTFNPTSTPTTSPTAVPTVSPSLQPSTSFAPTDSPAPSAAPSPSFEFEKQSFLRENVEMTFSVASLLRRSLQTEPDFCTQLASNRIQQLIDQEVKSKIVSFERVLVSILNPSRSSTESLKLDFDVLIEIRSVVEVTDTDIKEFIEGPFDTAVERDIFLEELQEQDCFRTSTAVGVVVPAIEPRGPQTSLIGLIAGLAIAAIAIILLGILFIFLRARRHDAVDDEDAVTRPFALETAHPNGYANNDENENDIDISTLGDPIPKGEQADVDQDQATLGSTSLEYDYKKAFQDQNSVTDSKVLGSMEGTMEGTSPFLTLATPEDPALAGMFGDAEEDTIGSNFTTEEQYEVVAPAGLLGLILESSLEDGRPTVNNVKATSVLASVVRIGDRLLSVDGQDVTKMSANEVSFLLATKKESPARVMLFGRSLRLLPEPGNDSISEVK